MAGGAPRCWANARHTGGSVRSPVRSSTGASTALPLISVLHREQTSRRTIVGRCASSKGFFLSLAPRPSPRACVALSKFFFSSPSRVRTSPSFLSSRAFRWYLGHFPDPTGGPFTCSPLVCGRRQPESSPNVRAPGRREGGGAVEWQWRSEEDSSALGGRYCTVVCGVVPVHVHVHVHVECSCVTL